MEQVALAARVAPQAFAPVVIAKSLEFAPVMVGSMLLSVAVPLFERVAASAAEVVPLSVLGKLNGEVSEAPGAVPVPVRVEVWGEPEALSATESKAEKLAAEAGVKVT
jgi:hypothetical protein